jgi:hypothetical protein
MAQNSKNVNKSTLCIKNRMATKDDLKGFATKDDLSALFGSSPP